MSRRFGLPAVYTAAALATAVTTVASLAITPASGIAARADPDEPVRPYIVTAKSRADARLLVREARWRVRRYYTAALPGFASWLTAREAAELRTDARVRSLEPDRRVHPQHAWGPDRVDRRVLPLDGRVRASATGRGVTVYVVDSGVEAGHAEFGDRAWRAFDATGGDGSDCTGHGTQVAGIAAGGTHGVAPGARVASVRVLGCQGWGSLSDVIAGVDWVRGHARGPAVANLSIGGDDSPALDRAVRNLARAGVFVVAAAGNDGTDACLTSPAGARGVFTVAASGAGDHRAEFSNHGPCVEMYAPGVDVTTARRGGGLRRVSGTSAAAPHASGAAALYLESHVGARPSTLASWLKSTATRGEIRQNPSRTSNLLQHSGRL